MWTYVNDTKQQHNYKEFLNKSNMLFCSVIARLVGKQLIKRSMMDEHLWWKYSARKSKKETCKHRKHKYKSIIRVCFSCFTVNKLKLGNKKTQPHKYEMQYNLHCQTIFLEKQKIANENVEQVRFYKHIEYVRHYPYESASTCSLSFWSTSRCISRKRILYRLPQCLNQNVYGFGKTLSSNTIK